MGIKSRKANCNLSGPDGMFVRALRAAINVRLHNTFQEAKDEYRKHMRPELHAQAKRRKIRCRESEAPEGEWLSPTSDEAEPATSELAGSTTSSEDGSSPSSP